ncbi:MAG: hypothetical protein HN472_13060 [Nitrospina sp.]|nr:hypothetical protein [Nitrospina sp.]MBT3510461.1 hypothetical protein [Nitrospina sp.]MBT3875778.1 hypothetical protein [Nitrospina sp.]MBT4049225.1 hypothetical protein [Nitrospina sp.]MBT4557193.1 hypothetical protein [Nitrospina sp.]
MAKKSNGTRNFYRFMSLIGVGVIGSLSYSFMSAAPDIKISEYHQATTPAEQCMQCHIQGEEKIPIMPHRPMGTCTMCHTPTDKPY